MANSNAGPSLQFILGCQAMGMSLQQIMSLASSYSHIMSNAAAWHGVITAIRNRLEPIDDEFVGLSELEVSA